MIKQFKIDESVYVVKGVEGLEGLVGRVIGEGEMKGEVEVEFEDKSMGSEFLQTEFLDWECFREECFVNC
tara:strand:+ start:401 stop:610 length:210 start_codon:yes stop_codon:yes gene_type:complete